MKGDKKVLAHLNALLAGELTAADQYFTHARMYAYWGLPKLHEYVAHEMAEELDHASQLIARILFLEGVPDLSKRDPLTIGKSVPEMMANDLELELKVVAHLREVIAYCEQVNDYQTREILRAMLADTEEDHTDWLEKQIGLIDKTGLQNYLQSQM
ncbi:bacterioferritin [Paraburkholderia caballeronis]|uniref:bacterioferritin n=1 Tax=Paraburkholderia caballeronis TaxID=416943 RepID=UPI00106623EA|nr:bacterioferritin [Paraburkholderia caballeronis]TDV20978.1 bacterioferritin [Paraburkholderia caballeronis]TDV21407.1 bacterioferritin [Paraburkholderia caballeronis]TDV33446.1 bacterioferritin [Paraburkholderia caballeronis]